MSLMLGLSFFHQGYRLKHFVDTSVRCFLYGGTGWQTVAQMVHGGTSFGFQSGANTGAFSFDFQPDITSYDYVSFDLRTDG